MGVTMRTPNGEPIPTPHEQRWIDLEDVIVVPLVEVPQLLIAPEEFFPGIDDARTEWYFASPWYERHRLVYTIQSFLLVTPEGTVLVDGCVGAAKHRSRSEFHMQAADLLGRVLDAGLHPGAVY